MVQSRSESDQRQAEMLRNRLRKRARHLRKWARRDSVSCYRLYDRDIPEVAMSIDWYDGYVVAAHFERDEEERGDSWRDLMGDAIAEALECDRARVYVRTRQRQRGAAQYERRNQSDERVEVGEGGHRFLVNLGDYLDTGLFLDHRVTRRLVADECRGGGRFLNLFCYTGAFTVYAAGAGATHTTSVDLSNNYLDWARANLAANDLAGGSHEFVREDAFAYLEAARARGQLFDVAVVDPPTFSNSKKMTGTWDVQRDHARLLSAVAGVVIPGGVVYFSTNKRKFSLRLSGDELTGEEITEKTVPPDFRIRPHRAWRFERR